MSELRWNPLLRTWTIVASNRKKRPNMPQGWCPFCPGEGKKVPEQFDVYAYDNDFPALSQTPDAPYVSGEGLYKSLENYGKCEVILYSPEHEIKFYELSEEHIVKLLNLICDRSEALYKDANIKYVYPFENKGPAVGVTMPHPHGQLYGFNHVPQKIRVEIESSKDHFHKHGTCLVCDMNKAELREQVRVVGENDSFVAYIPFFTDYPYGVFVVPKRHMNYITDCTEQEKRDLAHVLKTLTEAFDRLFDAPFPYMMVYHQNPINSEEYEEAKEYYHFHIQFYPPFRAPNTIKYYASAEMGAWAATNTSAVEETAPVLKALYEQVEKENS